MWLPSLFVPHLEDLYDPVILVNREGDGDWYRNEQAVTIEFHSYCLGIAG